METRYLQLPLMDGFEIQPDIFLIGEPTPIPRTNLMRCLANVYGTLCVIEFRIIFK